jgi:hypothetical protein
MLKMTKMIRDFISIVIVLFEEKNAKLISYFLNIKEIEAQSGRQN